tara:strand:+ start:128 stop:547 length:420 start_codon:yes stop_codon:yes gene_type:complete
MDIDKIFSMFTESESEETLRYVKQSISYKDHPYFAMGIFHKLINREDNTSLHLIVASLNVDEETQADIISLSVHLTYSQAYNQLNTINLENEEHLDFLRTYNDPRFKVAANKALNYFTEVEQYEKCSYLKQILDQILFL